MDQRIHRAIEQVRYAVNLDWDRGPSYVTPLYDLFDAFPITVKEIAGLTYRQAAQFVAAQTGHEAIRVPGNAEQPLAGLLYAYKYQDVCRACILVHRDDPVERRRFTVAHELGHYIMHFLPFAEGAPSDGPNMPLLLEGLSHTQEEALSDYEEAAEVTVNDSALLLPHMNIAQMEREANAFAAALLMPDEVCRKLIKAYKPQYGCRRSVLARRMASDFLVSKLAMRWRLENLGLGLA